jgi:hypothetical protein
LLFMVDPEEALGNTGTMHERTIRKTSKIAVE